MPSYIDGTLLYAVDREDAWERGKRGRGEQRRKLIKPWTPKKLEWEWARGKGTRVIQAEGTARERLGGMKWPVVPRS